MIVKLYYEKKTETTEIEVSDEECSLMIQTDYEMRLCNAKDGEEVQPRSVQEILDEEINKPTFNNNQTETRRHCSLDAMQEAGMDLSSEDNIELPDEKYAELRAAIAQLKPEQQELLRKVFYEEIKQVDIAKSESVGKTAIENRMIRIYSRLKKLFKN